MKRILPICLLFVLSCSSKKDYSTLLSNIESDSSIENVMAFVGEIENTASIDNSDEGIKTLTFGLEKCVALNLPVGKEQLLYTLNSRIKSEEPDQVKAMEKLIDLSVKNKIRPMSMDTLLYYLADLSSKKQSNGTLDQNLSEDYISVSSLLLPMVNDNAKKAELVFKSAEMANAIGNHNQAIELFDQVIENYKETEKAPLSLFLKAFTYENNLGDLDNAKFFYQLFLNQYPDHKMAKDVEFLVKNLGVSGEDLIKAAQQNQ